MQMAEWLPAAIAAVPVAASILAAPARLHASGRRNRSEEAELKAHESAVRRDGTERLNEDDPNQEYEFYARPENQEPKGAPIRRGAARPAP